MIVADKELLAFYSLEDNAGGRFKNTTGVTSQAAIKRLKRTVSFLVVYIFFVLNIFKLYSDVK